MALLVASAVCGWFCLVTPEARQQNAVVLAADPQKSPTTNDDPVSLLAAAIDRHIAARWTEENVSPAQPAEDAEFLRRTYLNIVGRIPTASEAEQFLDEPGTAKRRALVDRLLASSAYPTHFAELLRLAIVP